MTDDRVDITINISRKLFDIIPELAVLDMDDKDRPEDATVELLYAMAEETVDNMENRKFSRDIALTLAAESIRDEAKAAICDYVYKAVLAQKEMS